MPEIYCNNKGVDFQLFFGLIIYNLLQRMGEPLEFVYPCDLTAFKQWVEHGIIFGTTIILAEKVVFTSYYRGALIRMVALLGDCQWQEI